MRYLIHAFRFSLKPWNLRTLWKLSRMMFVFRTPLSSRRAQSSTQYTRFQGYRGSVSQHRLTSRRMRMYASGERDAKLSPMFGPSTSSLNRGSLKAISKLVTNCGFLLRILLTILECMFSLKVFRTCLAQNITRNEGPQTRLAAVTGGVAMSYIPAIGFQRGSQKSEHTFVENFCLNIRDDPYSILRAQRCQKP